MNSSPVVVVNNILEFAGLTFEISEGGFLDIDVKIVGPDDKPIYEGNRETSGKYTFNAHAPGVYTYCFSNKMSTMTPKVVMFNMEIGEPTKEKEPGAEGNLFAIILQHIDVTNL